MSVYYCHTCNQRTINYLMCPTCVQRTGEEFGSGKWLVEGRISSLQPVPDWIEAYRVQHGITDWHMPMDEGL